VSNLLCYNIGMKKLISDGRGKINNKINQKIISTGEPGSFAVEDLLSQADRVTKIIIENNALSDSEIVALEKLRNDIKINSTVEKLSHGLDEEEWSKLLDLDNVHTWLDDFHHGLRISYFHRLLLDKINYFEKLKDPYQSLKKRALKVFFENILDKKVDGSNLDEILEGMLWGNKFDLVPPTISDKKEIICDDRDEFKKFLSKGIINQIDIIADNAGQELFFDLLFACFVIDNKKTKRVILHLKNYPYNVSDATKDDFFYLLAELRNINQLKRFGAKLEKYILSKKIEAITYPFTTLGYDRHLAGKVKQDIYYKSSLIITKGDFNYRKNVGWYYWNLSDCYKDVISYFKSPLLCFRAVKNEVLIGTSNTSKIKNVSKDDPEWWKKGIGGMILFQCPNRNMTTSSQKISDYWSKTK